MNNTDNNTVLLPAGFRDVLPPYAAQESRITARLLEIFELFGYEQVRPPMVEFEASLVSGKGERLSNQTFRIMDPHSREMMGIRADMTMQIARMASVRLRESPRPLRLSYAGEVLRVKGEGISHERQFTQAGIELIGNSSAASDVEAILVAVEALQRPGLENISIDFNLPQLSGIVMDEAGTPADIRKSLLELVERKDIASIKGIDDAACGILAEIIAIAGEAGDVLGKFDKIDLPAEGRSQVDNLRAVVDAVSEAESDLPLTIDPLERRGFEYHTGVGFSLFSRDNNEELGRGGRYVIGSDAGGNNEGAVGFTLSVGAIMRSLPVTDERERQAVPAGTSIKSTASLRDKGIITVHGLQNEK